MSLALPPIPSGPAPAIHTNGLSVLSKQLYLWPKTGGGQETPEEMFWRVAYTVAKAELVWGSTDAQVLETATKFYEMMSSGYFIPNTPTMVNAGKPNGQLAACFVLGIQDSTDSIYATLRAAALVQTSGGGTGFSGYRLRCRNSLVGTTGKRSGGSNTTLKLYDASSDIFITQGSARKGANMWTLPAWHGDLLEFIDVKLKDGEVKNFNISVGATDAFMEAAERREDWWLLDPKDGRKVAKVNAGEVMDKIIFNAWANAEPGLLFIDRANLDNPTPQIGMLMATNPCGEQWLLDDEACTLGHLNIARFVRRGAWGPEIDWASLERHLRLAVRFLDNVVEVNHYPLPQIEKMHKFGNRKIGSGFLGWHDALVAMDMPYDSDEARSLAQTLSEFHEIITDSESVNLAQTRGPFANFQGSALETKFPQGIRNACRRTWAPTGSTSIVIPHGPASSGCEPIFGLVMVRNQAGMTMTEVNPTFQEYMDGLGLNADEQRAAIEHVLANGTVKGAPFLPARAAELFVQANEVSMEGHVLMQAALQKHVDNSISKTINLNEYATVEDVRKAYWLAWKTGCKGITVYRDKSRSGQVLAIATKSSAEIKQGSVLRYEPQAAAGIATPSAAMPMEPPLPPKPAKWANKKKLEECPNCQSKNVDHGSGCFTCLACGTSLC